MTQPKVEDFYFDSTSDSELSSTENGKPGSDDDVAVKDEPLPVVSYDTTDPTSGTYSGLTEAYAFFNVHLFSGRLQLLAVCLLRYQARILNSCTS